jgi:late competence protein required for DNA uptake (superfamily II DNA/RNA helicase)
MKPDHEDDAFQRYREDRVTVKCHVCNKDIILIHAQYYGGHYYCDDCYRFGAEDKIPKKKT